MKTIASAAVLALALPFAAAAAEGTASGTLTANGKAATVKMATATKAGDDWQVKISDVAVPSNEYEAVDKGTLHLLTLTLDAKGGLTQWQMGHKALEGLFLSTARADLKITKMGPASIEGTIKRASDSFGSNTVAFDVTFSAKVQ